MHDSSLVLYGTSWCGDTWRTRTFLDKKSIPYQWIDIDRDRAGREFVERTNHGNRSVPTLVFPDGSILVEPSIEELTSRLIETGLLKPA